MDIIVEVVKIEGQCPVYEVGDVFYLLDGYKLKSDKPLCMHSLTSLLPYYNSLSRGVEPRELGLGEDKKAFVQCLDPADFTGGGTVTFALYKNE